MAEPVAVPKPEEPKSLTPQEIPAPSSAAPADTAAAPAAAEAAPAPAATATATAAAAAAGTQTKKRKLEDGEFRNSNYFKIRSILKDLRPHFIEVVRAPDFQNSNAANDIRKQMKTMIDLLKDLSSEIASGGKSKKLHEEQRPSAGAVKEEHEEKHQEGPAPPRQPQTGGIPTLSENVEEKAASSDGIPIKKETTPETGETASMPDGVPARKPSEKITETTEFAKHLDECHQGTSYVVGGSPIGWNYLVYPGGPLVSYGETKTSKLASRAAK